MSFRTNLSFSGFNISEEGKLKLNSLYRLESMNWVNLEYRNIIQVPKIPDGLEADEIGLVILMSMLSGSRATKLFQVKNGQLIDDYLTCVDVERTALCDSLLAGRETTPKQRRSLKEKLNSLFDGLMSREDQYFRQRKIQGTYFGATLGSNGVVDIQKELIMTIIRDKWLAPNMILGHLAVLYGYCSFMYKDASPGGKPKAKYRKGLVPGCAADEKDQVVLSDGTSAALGNVFLPIAPHYRNAAWGKLAEVAKLTKLSEKTVRRYLKTLRQMDVIRSVVVSSGTKQLSIDFTRYNNYGLYSFFMSPNRKREYNKVSTLWCYGTKFEDF